jgi:type II secretory pathway component PulF
MTDYVSPNSDYSPSPDPRNRPSVAGAIFREIFWIVASVILLGLLTGALSIAMAQVSAMTPFIALLLVLALAMVVRAVRRRQALLAVNYLEQAVRQNLPIPLMLGAAEQTETGGLRWRLGKLRTQIERGKSVSTALAITMPGTSPRTLGLIESGERLGRLGPILTRIVRRPPIIRDDRDPTRTIYLRWYPLVMTMTLAMAGIIIVTYVIPKYKDLLHDFGIPLPPITAFIADAFVTVIPVLAVVMTIIFALVLGRTVASIFPPAAPPFDLWKWIADRVAWITPIWRGVTRNRGLADVCQVVADALDVGQPVDRALFEAAAASTNSILRRRILTWAQTVTSGVPLPDAARQAGLPALVSNMFRTAHGPDGAHDVFLFLARYYDSRHSAAAALLQGAAIPVMVGVFGTIVAILGLGMFMPLIELMKRIPVMGRVL